MASTLLGEHVKPVVHGTIGSTVAVLLVAGGGAVISWFKGLPFHWAAVLGVGLVLGLSLAAFLLSMARAVWLRKHDAPLTTKEVSPEKEPVINQHEACERTITNLQTRNRALEEQDTTRGFQIQKRDGQIASLQEQYDETEWLRDIAKDQSDIQNHLDIESAISTHDLLGDNPYINFLFSVTNRCVYKISLLDELSGPLYFGERRLSMVPILSDNSVKNLTPNETKGFIVSQSLTSREAARILTDVPGQFRLYDLHAKFVGSPNLTESVELNWLNLTGPITSKEFIDNNYPKLDIRITPLPLHTYFGRRADSNYPKESLGTVLNLQVIFRNPRPIKVRQFKLITSGPVIAAETGEIKDNPYRDANGRLVPFGNEMSPNLANLNIDIGRGNVTDGWLQFIIRDVPPPKMLNPSDFVMRLHIVDESSEEHWQDVTGLQWMGNN